MTLLPILSPETYRSLEKKLGEKEAQELANALDASASAVDKADKALAKVDEALLSVRDKADFLITQKKFELKDELAKELATKADIAIVRTEIAELRAEFADLKGTVKAELARLEGEIQKGRIELDRKFTLMFYILLFAIIFLNQNALEFIAKLFRLM